MTSSSSAGSHQRERRPPLTKQTSTASSGSTTAVALLYIASAAQLVLVTTGTYRLAVDARAHVPRIGGPPTQTAKPYDVSGAVLCAREAGAAVLDLDGAPLDVPLDVTSPVGFCAFANEATRARLWPELAASLAAWRFE